MKKENLIKALLMFINMLIFVNFSIVKADPPVQTIEIVKYKILEGYKACYKTTSADYLKTKMTDNGLMVYVAKKGKGLFGAKSVTERMDCVKNDNTEESILFSIPKNAVVYNPENSGTSSNNDSSSNDGSSSNNSTSTSDSTAVGCEGLLGNPEIDGTPANFLQKTLRFIQFCGPILVIIMTIMESIKAVTSGDKDELTKMLKKTTMRVIYAVMLFVFPAILDIILSWTNVYGNCIL